MRLTEGMIRPIRARGSARAAARVSFSAMASMLRAPFFLLYRQSDTFGQGAPIGHFPGQELVEIGDVHIHRQGGLPLEVIADFLRLQNSADLPVELLDDLRRQVFRAGQPEPSVAVHLGIALFGESWNVLVDRAEARTKDEATQDDSLPVVDEVKL